MWLMILKNLIEVNCLNITMFPIFANKYQVHGSHHAFGKDFIREVSSCYTNQFGVVYGNKYVMNTIRVEFEYNPCDRRQHLQRNTELRRCLREVTILRFMKECNQVARIVDIVPPVPTDTETNKNKLKMCVCPIIVNAQSN